MPAKKVEKPELEVWENSGLSQIGVRKFDSQGNIVSELIQGHRKVYVTPEERRLNQEVAASDDLDVFKNGRLVPVRLVDSDETVEDNKAIQANPNAMSETAMKALFRSQAAAFKSRIDEISNEATLNRLLEVASDVDASVRQFEAVQKRLKEVAAKNGPVVHEVGFQAIGSAIGTKAPESPGRNPIGRAVSPR